MFGAIVWDISPSVFSEFELLRWYGIFWMIGVVVGYRIMTRIYKVESIPLIELDKLAMYVMIGGIVGARLGHILFYDPVYYLNNPIEILPIKINPSFQFTGLAGLASHGGILGALFALYLYTRKYDQEYFWLLDRLMIAGAALAGFIRLGNLMNSEIIGKPTDVPWAFIFSRIDQLPRHPAQLYEAVFYLLLSVVLFFIWRSRRFASANGFLFGLGIASIFTQRFLVEFLKENQVSFEAQMALNMGQILSIPLVLVGIGVMVWSWKRNSTDMASK